MIQKIAITVLMLAGSVNLAYADRVTDYKREIGLVSGVLNQEKMCKIYLVHHGDTDWTVEERLQGVTYPTSLNTAGIEQMQTLAAQLEKLPVAAIYSSDLKRAIESTKILAEKLHCPVIFDADLRGEGHGTLEGKKKEEYERDAHYMKYIALPPSEKFFTPVGAGGTSKADVMKRVIPILNKIAAEHSGETVVVMTHGGIFKGLSFLLDVKTGEEEGFVDIAHGDYIAVEGDGEHLFRIE